MTSDLAKRGVWGSKLTFVLAAAGSAVGLGNIWGFPTQTGLNGGAGFVFVYICCVLAIGVPLMIAEFTIGRRTKSDPVGAFKALAPGTPWKWVGGLGVTTGVGILSFYCIVAGWTLAYIWLTFAGVFEGLSAHQVAVVFSDFAADPWKTLFFQFFFLVLTVLVVSGGIQGGIERFTKILMPLLLALLLLLVLRSVTLPGAGEGIAFYLKPDVSRISADVVLAALGQAFFSLSLGMGGMITYGSYLSDREDIVSSAFYVSFSDLVIALLAGFAIFPALFSVKGLAPDAGPGLIFVVLPNIFNHIPLGQVFGIFFYLLLAIAALTSSIALLEVVVAYLIDQRGWKRKTAAWSAGAVIFLCAIPCALGNGAVPVLSGSLERADFLFGKLSLIVGGFFISVFLGWKWGVAEAAREILKSKTTFRLEAVWMILIRFVCPLGILLILGRTLFSYL